MTRLYNKSTLQPGLIPLTVEQSHYVLHVLRLSEKAPVSVFNERDGEWKGHLVSFPKKLAGVCLEAQVRLAEPRVPVHLVFAPLKNEATHFLIEKATELGATDFWPVVTRYTVNRFNETRAQAHALMAVQQCERLDVPIFHPIQKLSAFLASWLPSHPLYVAAERNERALPLLTAVKQGTAFMIGPEGGLALEDWQLLEACTFVQRITLGKNILRAETAAVMCLSVLQAEKIFDNIRQ